MRCCKASCCSRLFLISEKYLNNSLITLSPNAKVGRLRIHRWQNGKIIGNDRRLGMQAVFESRILNAKLMLSGLDYEKAGREIIMARQQLVSD